MLQKELERHGYRVQVAPDGEAALRKARRSNVDVLLCEHQHAHAWTAWNCAAHYEDRTTGSNHAPGQATVETAVEAMKLGAYDYLTKPYSITELDVRVQQAAEKRDCVSIIAFA